MSAPDKNGNFAKCALSSAGTSSEEQGRSKVSARILQGRSKRGARIKQETCKRQAREEQGCSKYVPSKSLGCRKKPAEELQGTCRPEQREDRSRLEAPRYF